MRAPKPNPRPIPADLPADFLIDNASVHWNASKNPAYRQRVIDRFTTWLRFLQQHGLSRRQLLPERATATHESVVRRDQLTGEGFARSQIALGNERKTIDSFHTMQIISATLGFASVIQLLCWRARRFSSESENQPYPLIERKMHMKLILCLVTITLAALPAVSHAEVSWSESENGGTTIAGTWTFDPDGKLIRAKWQNGASAVLTLASFGNDSVVVTRSDTEGATKGLTARYEGKREGNAVHGTVTWSWNGRSWNGTWNASWSATTELPKKQVQTAATNPAAKVGFQLSNITGDVGVRTGTGDWKDAKPGESLSETDEIHTGPGSSVTITWPNGSSITVRESTQIAVGQTRGDANNPKIQVLLRMGEIAAKANHPEETQADFSVKTPDATCAVKGTRFTVADRGQGTTVVVLEGSVTVTPLDPSVAPTILNAGQQVKVGK